MLPLALFFLFGSNFKYAYNPLVIALRSLKKHWFAIVLPRATTVPKMIKKGRCIQNYGYLQIERISFLS